MVDRRGEEYTPAILEREERSCGNAGSKRQESAPAAEGAAEQARNGSQNLNPVTRIIMKGLQWFGLWLLFAVVFAVLLGGQCMDYWRLMENGRLTQGIVTERKPHNQLAYSFEINGRTYTNPGARPDTVFSYEHSSPGDTIAVHFLAGSPTVNCLANPKRLFKNEITSVLLGCIAFPSLAVIALAIFPGFGRYGVSWTRRKV